MSTHKENPEQTSEFKVSDHRRFNTDGTEKKEFQETSYEIGKNPVAEKIEEALQPDSHDLPEMSFANLILSLAGSCQMNLGIAPNPFTHQVEKNLNQAKQTIDLLGVLAEKTKGNLTAEEDQLLQVILTDLRLHYVKETKTL